MAISLDVRKTNVLRYNIQRKIGNALTAPRLSCLLFVGTMHACSSWSGRRRADTTIPRIPHSYLNKASQRLSQTVHQPVLNRFVSGGSTVFPSSPHLICPPRQPRMSWDLAKVRQKLSVAECSSLIAEFPHTLHSFALRSQFYQRLWNCSSCELAEVVQNNQNLPKVACVPVVWVFGIW